MSGLERIKQLLKGRGGRGTALVKRVRGTPPPSSPPPTPSMADRATKWTVDRIDRTRRWANADDIPKRMDVLRPDRHPTPPLRDAAGKIRPGVRPYERDPADQMYDSVARPIIDGGKAKDRARAWRRPLVGAAILTPPTAALVGLDWLDRKLQERPMDKKAAVELLKSRLEKTAAMTFGTGVAAGAAGTGVLGAAAYGVHRLRKKNAKPPTEKTAQIASLLGRAAGALKGYAGVMKGKNVDAAKAALKDGLGKVKAKRMAQPGQPFWKGSQNGPIRPSQLIRNQKGMAERYAKNSQSPLGKLTGDLSKQKALTSQYRKRTAIGGAVGAAGLYAANRD